jgi:hypothetical protein
MVAAKPRRVYSLRPISVPSSEAQARTLSALPSKISFRTLLFSSAALPTP